MKHLRGSNVLRINLRALAGAVVAPLALLALGVWMRVVGSGVVKSESRPVSGFDEVTLAGSGTLSITQTGAESLTIQADDNILPLLTSDVSGHRLVLGTKPNTSYETRNRVVYQVTMRDLRGLFISGSGDATATDISASAMTVTISGSGTVRLSGHAQSQSVTISGSGTYEARDFATGTANVTVTGSGDAHVNCTGDLTVRITGSGNVTYAGTPSVHQSVLGSGSVRRR